MFRNLKEQLHFPALDTSGGFNGAALSSTAANDTATWISMREYEQGMGVFVVTTHGGTDTLTCAITQATSAAGVSKKVLSGAGYAAVTVGATAGSGAVAVVPFLASAFDTTNAFYFAGCRVTSSGTASHVVTAILVRGECHHASATMPA